MNIGIDIRPLMSKQQTGVEKYTRCLLETLFTYQEKNNFYLFYNSYQDCSVPDWDKYGNVHLVATDYPNKLLNLSLFALGQPKFDKIISRRFNVSLDIFFYPNINFSALSEDIPRLLTIHDLSFEIYPECYSTKSRLWHKLLAIKQKIHESQYVLCPSQNTKRDLIELYEVNPEKIKVLTPGVDKIIIDNNDCSQVKQEFNLTDNFLFYLGTVEPRKNIAAAISAFDKLDLHNYEFILAGADGWNNDKIKQKVENTTNVRYIGYVSPKQKQALLQLADVFIYPSLYEGFGFPVLEAMEAETSVITSNRSSLPEITQGAAYLVDPLQIDEIATAIKRLISHQELVDGYIKKGKKCTSQFCWENTAEEFLTIAYNAAKSGTT